MFRRAILLLVVPTLATAQEPTSAQTEETDPGIVFVSDRDGIEDIYVMLPDGTGVRRVTVTETVAGESRGSWVPAWSPDDKQIVFASNRDEGGSANLYVVDADGSNLRRLTRHTGFDYTPDWSPDGERIAFMSTRDGSPDVYVMDSGGSNVTRLTEGEENLCCPDWSPDGVRIAFHAAGHIQVMNADGGNRLSLGRGGLPRWSPDGERIAFVRAFQVHVMQADGSDVRKVTDVQGRAVYPVWSPDGNGIAFTFLPEGEDFAAAEVCVVNLDGTGIECLTDNDVYDGHANWW